MSGAFGHEWREGRIVDQIIAYSILRKQRPRNVGTFPLVRMHPQWRAVDQDAMPAHNVVIKLIIAYNGVTMPYKVIAGIHITAYSYEWYAK